MKTKLSVILAVCFATHMVSCGENKQATPAINATPQDSHSPSYYTPQQSVVKTTADSAAKPVSIEPMSDVESAYEEGAAQAEEDRLAGHPGANYADDYDDDDENEAYEDGYEDE